MIHESCFMMSNTESPEVNIGDISDFVIFYFDTVVPLLQTVQCGMPRSIPLLVHCLNKIRVHLDTTSTCRNGVKLPNGRIATARTIPQMLKNRITGPFSDPAASLLKTVFNQHS